VGSFIPLRKGSQAVRKGIFDVRSESNAEVAGLELARHLTFVREPRKIPVILSLEEIVRLLEAAPGPKYKAALPVSLFTFLP
jgi:hypothetical protein